MGLNEKYKFRTRQEELFTGNGEPARNPFHACHSLQQWPTSSRKHQHFFLLKQQGPQPPYPPRGGGDEFINTLYSIQGRADVYSIQGQLTPRAHASSERRPAEGGKASRVALFMSCYSIVFFGESNSVKNHEKNLNRKPEKNLRKT